MTDPRSADDADATDQTRLSARRAGDVDDTVRLPPRRPAHRIRQDDAAAARAAHSPDPQALRPAGPPRAAEPVRAERAAVAPRGPQPAFDGAAQDRTRRRIAHRRTAIVTAGAALVAAAAGTLLLVLLVVPG